MLAAAAASGDMDTCRTCTRAAGGPGVTIEVIAAAAASGNLPLCQWLLSRRQGQGPMASRGEEDFNVALEAAGSAAMHGHLHVCEWALGEVHKCDDSRNFGMVLKMLGLGGPAGEVEGADEEGQPTGAAAAPAVVMVGVAAGAAAKGHVSLLRWVVPMLVVRLGQEGREAVRKGQHAVRKLVRQRVNTIIRALRSVLRRTVEAPVGSVSYTDMVWLREQLAAAAEAATSPGEVAAALEAEGWTAWDVVAAVVGESAEAVLVEAGGGTAGGGGGAGALRGLGAGEAGRRLRLRVRWRPEHSGSEARGSAAAPASAAGSGGVGASQQGRLAGGGGVGRSASAAADPVTRAEVAALKGNVRKLEALRAAGHLAGRLAALAEVGARRGHVSVVDWALRMMCHIPPALGEPMEQTCTEVVAVKTILTEGLMEAAASSGSTELVRWLRERGCPWGPGAFAAAAEAGCVELLELMAEGGCPMGVSGGRCGWG